MRVVYADDHRFIPVGDEVLSKGSSPSTVWTRFLDVFESMVVIGREKPTSRVDDPGDCSVSSREGVRFRFVPSLAGAWKQIANRSRVMEVVEEEVEKASSVIARLPTENGFLAIRAAEKLGRLWAVELAGCPWDGLWNHGGIRSKVYAPVMWWRTRRAVARAPFVLYVTEEFLQARYPCEAGRTVGCSDVQLPPPDPSVLERRLDDIRGGGAVLTFGLIGSLTTRVKGIQTALSALSEVRSRLPDFRFRILGQGDPELWREAATRHGLGDVVAFEGTRPAGEPVLEWLDKIDVYLQPSFKEGLPRALVEAMSRGCPAIGSTAGGIPELLPDDVLHTPGDSAGLARRLLDASDREWRLAQARRNWERSLDYAPAALEDRRRLFWEQFARRATQSAGASPG